MMGAINSEFGMCMSGNRVADFIASAEGSLRAFRKTPFHAVVGRTFLHQRKKVVDYLDAFLAINIKKKVKGAVYCEMNGFTINTDRWHFDAFGYKRAGEANGLDWDWLASWDSETEKPFVLTDMETVQAAFRKNYGPDQPLALQIASELAEYLVAARFIELIESAVTTLRKRNPVSRKMPFFATMHGSDDILFVDVK